MSAIDTSPVPADPRAAFTPAPAPAADPSVPSVADEDAEDEHGELYEASEALLGEVRRRQKNYGGLPPEPGDDAEKIKRSADRFIARFSRELGEAPTPTQIVAAVALAVRDEFRDNAYDHLKRTVDLGLDAAAEIEDIGDDVDDIRGILLWHKQEIDRLSAATSNVVIKQLVCLSKLLATACVSRGVTDPEILTIARTILDTHEETPAVQATTTAGPAPATAATP